MKEDALKTAEEIGRLRNTLRILRGENGCPWDREQSIDDIITNMIDETYELLHAEKTGDLDHVEEELGDVLFLVLFVHELLIEKRDAPLADIIARVHHKIRQRHPHVFGTVKARNRLESVSEWERIKKLEGKRSVDSGALGDLPPVLPPLRKAVLVQKRAAGVGFDWPDETGIIDKIREEIEELCEALDSGERRNVKEEIGDLLFTMANLARRLGVDPENTLEATTHKFVRRFTWMERCANETGRNLESMTLDEMESLWQESKRVD